MGQAQSNQHRPHQHQHHRHRSFLGYHHNHHRNQTSTSSRSTSAFTNGSTSTHITDLTNNSNQQILSISGSTSSPISSNIQSGSNNSVSINQSHQDQPHTSINLNQSRNSNRFLPLNSILKRSHRRPTTAEPHTSSSSISQQTRLNSASSSPNPSSASPLSSIPNSSTLPRHHRRPSWNTFLRHSFSPSRSSNRSSIPRFDTPISTPDPTHHPKQSNSQVLPLIDLQSPLPSLNSTITTIQSSNSNSPSTSDIIQNSSTTTSPSILTDSHLTRDQKEDLSSHSSIYPNTLTSLHSHSTTTDHLTSTLSSSDRLLPNNNISPSPSLDHVQEDHEPNDETGLGLDLSSTQELEALPNLGAPSAAAVGPSSGIQVPTRRIYVQGMVVARNVPDQITPNPPPRTLEQGESLQTTNLDELTSNTVSDDQNLQSTSQTISNNPSSVLVEQATMISRLLSVAAAATASSLLPNSINPDGTTISNTTPPLSPPMTANAEQVELHGGLQNTLRDALRVAFGSALMNGVTPTHQIPIPTPVPSSPVTPAPSSPIDRTMHTGTRIMRRLGLQSLLNHRNEEEDESGTTPEAEDNHSFENFLSSLQTDVGDAILEALGGNRSEEENEDDTFNFFRMHRFENGIGEEGLIPVLLVGVRSVSPNLNQRAGRIDEDGEEIRDQDDEAMFEGIRELFEESNRELPDEEEAFSIDQEEENSENEEEEEANSENRPIESLEPSEPLSVPLTSPSMDPLPSTHVSTTSTQEPRSWLIFVLAGLYPPLHPIFNTPTEYIPEGNQQVGTESSSESRRNLQNSNQLDYETMMRLAELIGVHKPTTVTANEIENAELTLINFQENTIEQVLKDGDVLENTVEKCLICLEDYIEDEVLRLLKCKHLFHKNCVDQWLMTGSATCPTCRDVAV